VFFQMPDSFKQDSDSLFQLVSKNPKWILFIFHEANKANWDMGLYQRIMGSVKGAKKFLPQSFVPDDGGKLPRVFMSQQWEDKRNNCRGKRPAKERMSRDLSVAPRRRKALRSASSRDVVSDSLLPLTEFGLFSEENRASVAQECYLFDLASRSVSAIEPSLTLLGESSFSQGSPTSSVDPQLAIPPEPLEALSPEEVSTLFSDQATLEAPAMLPQ
jgi:hypothetical protein